MVLRTLVENIIFLIDIFRFFQQNLFTSNVNIRKKKEELPKLKFRISFFFLFLTFLSSHCSDEEEKQKL